MTPRFLEASNEELEEVASRQLEGCPHLLALITKRYLDDAQGFDRAKDFDRVLELKSSRKTLAYLLDLKAEVDKREQYTKERQSRSIDNAQ